MGTVHILPIEPIEERYSADWLRWWPRGLRTQGLDVRVIDGASMYGGGRGDAIRSGQFLDAIDTHHYKATQLAATMQMLSKGDIKAGDAVLLLDGWNPTVEALAYARQIAHIDFSIVLVLHAGTWDPFDHLVTCGLGQWAHHAERAWLSVADRVLVATDFHAALILRHHGAHVAEHAHKIRVTGFPLELDELERYRGDRRPYVVFPHRLAPEKQPEQFQRLQEKYWQAYREDMTPSVVWVRTQDVYSNKAEFYSLLGHASAAFSSALQETWGIAQLEAWYLGATPIVPDRLSYSEIYPAQAKYRTLDAAAALVHEALHGQPMPFAPARDPRAAWAPIAQTIREVLR